MIKLLAVKGRSNTSDTVSKCQTLKINKEKRHLIQYQTL